MQWNLPSGEALLLPPKARAFTEPLLCSGTVPHSVSFTQSPAPQEWGAPSTRKEVQRLNHSLKVTALTSAERRFRLSLADSRAQVFPGRAGLQLPQTHQMSGLKG